MDEIKVGDIYKHNKYNDVYVILDIGRNDI